MTKYSDLAVLPTRAFLEPMGTDEEVVIQIEPGKQLFIKLKAVGELLENGCREVFFELNGIPRVIEVVDRNETEAAKGTKKSAARDKADPSVLGQVGAPMAGEVIAVKTTPGKQVAAGEPLVVLSAMKMETSVNAPCSGTLKHLGVEAGDSVAAGDLLVIIEDVKDPVFDAPEKAVA